MSHEGGPPRTLHVSYTSEDDNPLNHLRRDNSNLHHSAKALTLILVLLSRLFYDFS